MKNKVMINDEIIIKIVSIGSKGDGVGFHNGMAIFVKNTIIDTLYKVKIIKIIKNCAFGEII